MAPRQPADSHSRSSSHGRKAAHQSHCAPLAATHAAATPALHEEALALLQACAL